jgi:hypothetical protein
MVRLRRGSFLLACLAAACSVGQPKVPVDRYRAGDFAEVANFAEQELAGGDPENEAIVQNVAGQAQLFLGHIDAARRSFATAYQIMGTWATAGSEVYKAVFGNESSKTWRGDPYERGMNAVYLALCDLWHGEPDNARASLINGIMADAESGAEDAAGAAAQVKEDNALLFWMAGRMGRLAGSSDVEQNFADALKAHEFALANGARGDAANPILTSPKAGNLVVLVECGMGPEKFAKGMGDPIARFRDRTDAAVRAEVSVDGRPVGPAHVLADVFYQATTRGGTAMEGIRKGKAVVKIGAAVAGVETLKYAAHERDAQRAAVAAAAAGAFFLVALLVSSDADVRHWPTLPSTVGVATTMLPPGDHQLLVEFFDARGNALATLRQQSIVRVPARGEAWCLVRPAQRPAVAGAPVLGIPSPSAQPGAAALR